jgi:small subunit ribosomal protein S20
MALRHASAVKQARQSIKRRERNRAVLSGLKTATRKLQEALGGKKPDEVKAQLKKTASAWDKAATKGVIHPKKAAREVSHLTLKVNKVLSSKKSA